MSTQPTDSDTENPSDEEHSEEPTAGSAYAQLLATSSLEELEGKPWEVKLTLLQHHLELARIFVNELLEEEVEEKAGQRYSHDDSRFSRWGKNPGTVRIGEEKVPITVPRMIDTETEETFSPERYYQMKELPSMTGKMQEAILLGLSQGDYERVASSFVGGFGLSQSAVSERFIERSAKALEECETRSLEDLDLVALIMDAAREGRQADAGCFGRDCRREKNPARLRRSLHRVPRAGEVPYLEFIPESELLDTRIPGNEMISIPFGPSLLPPRCLDLDSDTLRVHYVYGSRNWHEFDVDPSNLLDFIHYVEDTQVENGQGFFGALHRDQIAVRVDTSDTLEVGASAQELPDETGEIDWSTEVLDSE